MVEFVYMTQHGAYKGFTVKIKIKNRDLEKSHVFFSRVTTFFFFTHTHKYIYLVWTIKIIL